jgi:hypothetical protein
MKPIGKKIWAIADGFIPGKSNGPEPDMTSHDTICFLNLSKSDAHITIKIYFSDRDPIGPYKVKTPAERTLHLRFNDLKDPDEIPVDTDFAVLIESDIPIIAQQTRLDSRQSENALFSLIPFSL